MRRISATDDWANGVKESDFPMEIANRKSSDSTKAGTVSPDFARAHVELCAAPMFEALRQEE
jgi:hypothetical protein